ncbi:hypothetical protein IWQ56_005462, partial [Coemansia nantahalensis]
GRGAHRVHAPGHDAGAASGPARTGIQHRGDDHQRDAADLGGPHPRPARARDARGGGGHRQGKAGPARAPAAQCDAVHNHGAVLVAALCVDAMHHPHHQCWRPESRDWRQGARLVCQLQGRRDPACRRRRRHPPASAARGVPRHQHPPAEL